MTFAEFAERFCPRITVALDCPVLFQLGPEVEHRVICSADSLGELGLPWYVDRLGGEERGVDDGNVRRLTVAEAGELLGGALEHRGERIEEKSAELAEDPRIVVATYRAKGRREILLDGCHRSVALIRRGEPFSVEAFSVLGPDDEGILRDLAVSD